MSDKAIGVHLKDWHIVQGVRTGNSPWSPIAIAQVPVKEPAPSAPTIESVTAPEASAGVLEIKVNLPETNADGTALARAELVRLRLHHSTSPGVDESDPYVDFPPSETLLWAPNDTVTHYVRVRVQDSHGLWSELSNEASGKANAAVVPQEDSGLWAHRLGVESIFTNDSPNPGYVSWSNVVLYWRDNKYEIEDGSTNKKYIWWDYSTSTTTFQTSDTRPELELEDVIIGYNDNGTWRLMCYQPTVMADYVRAGVLQSSNWGAAAGSQFNLDDGTFALGGSSSPALQWDGTTLTISEGNLGGSNVVSINSSGLDVGSLGSIRGGATAFETGTGFWMGYDTAYKLYIGDKTSDNYLSWDGSTLTVRGDISVDTISFDKITAGTNTASLVIGSGGYIKSSNYSAGSSGFIIYGNGNAEFNDVMVRGTVHSDSSSTIYGTPNLSSGTITASIVRTASSGNRAEMNPSGAYGHGFAIYNSSNYVTAWMVDGQVVAANSTGAARIKLDGSANTLGGASSSYPAQLVNVTGRFTYSGATIFNSTSPTGWTDLNLSGYVGSRRALVLLRVHNSGLSIANYRFRQNGTSWAPGAAVDTAPTVFSTRVGSGKDGFVWCITDSSGRIEWDADVSVSTTVQLIAYIT